MRRISFLASGCVNNKKSFRIERDYENNRQFEWPVEMGIASRDEVAIATREQLDMFNFQANKKLELLQSLGINPFS